RSVQTYEDETINMSVVWNSDITNTDNQNHIPRAQRKTAVSPFFSETDFSLKMASILQVAYYDKLL
ncbi:MAG: hypothetical protein AB2693_19265, partial [Candidatus Thiodiazotropha sp.]